MSSGKLVAFVADDDDDARALVVNTARRAGFRVEEASDGEALLLAVRKARDAGEHVAVVISDIGMPNVDGIEAAGELLKLEPTLDIVLMTAFGDQHTLAAARAIGVKWILRKPFALSSLAELIKRLGARSSAT